ncbi:hypothetical protein PSCICJ_32570 [Pseudomonas cichorii]|uniref:hypothetical protein n=1 Tax=Pseudomonas cichorii TaxID=36746 RepID=UPI0019108F76|nr:hypothetical protein [Pseudomonas cichorii]GFM67139.1 hypothetical protein PSCICJ_32570 [Pseudomonas cichorii]
MIAQWLTHLAFALVLFLILSSWTSSQRWRLAILAGASLASVVSIDGLSLASYVRSLSDDLAIPSLVGLVWLTAQRLGLIQPLEAPQRLLVLSVLAALALVLYPATLGITYFDPYRWGFNPRPMIIVVGALTLALLYLRNHLGALMLALATLAFTFRIKPSENYWDYLIDPFLALYGCVALLVFVARRLYRSRSYKVMN